MPMIDAYGERKTAAVMEDTWGHMRARPNIRHHGTIIFAEGVFGDDGVVILACDFGEDAGYGPWFYEHVQDWLYEQETEPGNIYTFSGWYRVTRKDVATFQGEITVADLVPRQ